MNKSSMQNQSAHEDGKIVDQAKQAVTHVASNVASQAKEQVNAQFDTRKDKAVETIGNVATAIRETGDKLKGVGPLGDVAGRAADGMEKVADFFDGKQVGDVVRDVERFARREPALFLGAAFALGLIGGRFLKSSAHRSSGQRNMGSSTYARSGGGGDYGRYETSYGSSFDDDQYDYLSDADLQDDIDSQRFGSYGSQRVGRTTQPQGSSFGATQGSPAGGSFGTSAGSGSSSGSMGTSTTTSKTATPSTSTTSPSTSTSTSTSKNGLGGGSGNTGSV